MRAGFDKVTGEFLQKGGGDSETRTSALCHFTAYFHLNRLISTRLHRGRLTSALP